MHKIADNPYGRALEAQFGSLGVLKWSFLAENDDNRAAKMVNLGVWGSILVILGAPKTAVLAAKIAKNAQNSGKCEALEPQKGHYWPKTFKHAEKTQRKF